MKALKPSPSGASSTARPHGKLATKPTDDEASRPPNATPEGPASPSALPKRKLRIVDSESESSASETDQAHQGKPAEGEKENSDVSADGAPPPPVVSPKKKSAKLDGSLRKLAPAPIQGRSESASVSEPSASGKGSKEEIVNFDPTDKRLAIEVATLEEADADDIEEEEEEEEEEGTKDRKAPWNPGADVPYEQLCLAFERINETSKRLEIMAHLTTFFRQVWRWSPHSMVDCIYLTLNRIGPEYEENTELGIGESILLKAVSAATGRDVSALKADMAKLGDLGLVAQNSKGKQRTIFKPTPLTVRTVFKGLKDISAITGNAAQQRKKDRINSLLVACSGNQPKYLIRSLEGKLRIGLAEQSVLVALAHSAAWHDKRLALKRVTSVEERAEILAEAVAIVKQVYSELPCYDKIVPALAEHGVRALPQHCKLTPGIPLKPMLAHPTKSITEVLDRFENTSFICEYKYDGERAQIHHLDTGKAVIFSRNSENLSAKYPDVLARLPKIPKEGVTSFVLDCEAVAWDVEKRCILPFQVLSTRKRKDVQQEDIKVQVCIFAFDLLYLNGRPLITETLAHRKELLLASFHECEGEFVFAKSMTATGVEEIQAFLDESVEGNCEGLMVKTLDKESSYEPSKRSRNWLKLKKDYLSGGIGDSLDLVVIGGYTGKGKRTGVYGGYLLACYDPEREEYQSICKIGTGFSDADLVSHANALNAHCISQPKPYYRYSDSPNIRPDVWFAPAVVWEVKAADLSISPVHKAGAGLVDSSKGISLRFPRFMRVRDDKGPEQATSAAQVADMYSAQSINHDYAKRSTGPAEDDGFEY